MRIQPWERDYQLQLDGVKADRLTAVHVRNPTGSVLEPLDGEDIYAITLPVSGALEIVTAQGHTVANERQMSVSDTIEHHRSRYAPGTELYCLFVDRAAVDEHLAEVVGRPPRGRVRFAPDHPRSGGVARLLTGLVEVALQGTRCDAPPGRLPLAWQNLQRAMVACLLEGVPHDHAVLAGRSVAGVLPRHVRRAIEFIDAHAHLPITIAEIASAAATSPRLLQAGFQQFQGMTPTAYLRNLRLGRVRADLLDPTQSSSIAEVATAWGFAHLGLFAARYRAAFGELPKDTLKRRR